MIIALPPVQFSKATPRVVMRMLQLAPVLTTRRREGQLHTFDRTGSAMPQRLMADLDAALVPQVLGSRIIAGADRPIGIVEDSGAAACDIQHQAARSPQSRHGAPHLSARPRSGRVEPSRPRQWRRYLPVGRSAAIRSATSRAAAGDKCE